MMRLASRAPFVHMRRSMSTFTSSQSSPVKKVVAAGAMGISGVVGGALGGVVGLAAHGSSVMVPALTSYANYSQQMATGTAAVAVVMTGVAGVVGFGTSGKVDPAKMEFGKVDCYAAFAVGCGAMLGAGFGKGITSRLNPIVLQRLFGVFQLVLAPMVPLKTMYDKKKAEEAALKAKLNARTSTHMAWGRTYDEADKYFARFVQLATIGVAAGAAFGMLGVGGGVVIAPALSLLTDMDHATVLGTTLAAMLPASAASAMVHLGAGNVSMAGAVPLSLATAAGAYGGSKMAVDMPEEMLQLAFAGLIFCLGGRRFLFPKKI